MPPKELGPLLTAQKEADVLKKKVGQIIKDSNKTIDSRKLKENEEKLKELYKNCIELKQEVTVLLETVKNLTEEQEPKKISRYAAKRNQELKRIEVWQNQLTNTMGKLLPNEIEEEYLKKLKKETEESSEEEEDEEEEDEEEEEPIKKHAYSMKTKDQKGKEDEEEDDDEDEDEDEEEEEDTEDNVKDKKHKDEKKPVTKEKAKVDKDEEDDEEEDEESGEEEETDEEEESKDVKTDKQKKVTKAKEDEEEDDEDEEEESESGEEEEEESKVEFTKSLTQFVSVAPFKAEEDGDLGFVKGEILTIIKMEGDWWTAENEKGEKGLVPSNLLQQYNRYKAVQQHDEDEDDDEDVDEEEDEEEDQGDGEAKPRRKRHGKELWGSVKKMVSETTVSDVLHAMGAVPSGFRKSTLSQAFNEGDTYRMNNFLSPKLSTSNLTYRDLFFDPGSSKIRPRKVKIERIITLVSCQQIPCPGSGVNVLSRQVRVCLFDGSNILSNIHTVNISDRNLADRTWSFSTRIMEKMNTSEHGEIFIRANNIVDNLGILFELCISYIRESTEQKDEFSCGWVHVPLLDQDGTFIVNKTFNLYVNGGTPYEKGVEVDPSISRRTSSNAFVSMLSGNKQPRLVVRIAVPKQDQKNQLEIMPEILVGNMVLLPFYSYFRQIMADVLLRDRLDLDSTELIHSPLLATFPAIADQPDLMTLLRDSWIEKLKTVRRADKRDEEFIKKLFKQIFLESVYPIVHTTDLPKFKTGNTDVEQKRHEQICHFNKVKQERHSMLAALLSSDLSFTPFNMKEVSFSIIGPHCLPKHIHTPVIEGPL